MKKSASIDMTQGSALSLLLRFTLPLLAGNALQQFYNMVDSIVVGQFVGDSAQVAVGISFPIVFLLSSLFMGIGMGATVLVSQFYGGGETENLKKTIDTVYTALIVGGIPLTIIGILLANPLLNAIQVPPDTREEAYLYLVIIMAGLLGSLGYNANAGILQGLGDSKTPLLLLAISCAINIGLDLTLVLVFDMAIAGVAIATIVAQAVSWIFGILYINKKYPQFRIQPFSFKFDKSLFGRIVKLGIPAGIQNAMFSFAILMMSRLVNQQGTIFAAGFNAANKLDTFAFLPIQSMATAVTTFTGQNIGAGKLHRVKDGTRVSMLLSVGFALLGLLVIPTGPLLLRMFTQQQAVVDAGMAYLYRILPFYSLLAASFVLNSVIRGAGESFIPMLASIVGMWLARVPSAYLLNHFFGANNMHFAYVIGWVVGMCITLPYYLSGRWKHKSVTRAGTAAEKALEPGD